MTVKLDIPALADAIDPRKWGYTLDGDADAGVVARCRDLIAASDALRSLTTALEIGRAMGMAQAAEICEEAAERCRTNEREQYGRGNGGGADIWAIRAVASEQRAAAIRSTAHALDLGGLTERLAWTIHTATGRDLDPDDWIHLDPAIKEQRRTEARAVLGLNAREN